MVDITQQELRATVQDLHTQAEKTKLSQDLIHGNINAQIYKNMCYQMWLITDAIEGHLKRLDPRITRRHQFVQDIAECPAGPVSVCPSTQDYVTYINEMYFPFSSGQLRGVLYTFYMGWMYGGQIVAKRLSVPTHHMQFTNVKWCIEHMRTKELLYLTHKDAEEACKAFEYVIKIYDELYESH